MGSKYFTHIKSFYPEQTSGLEFTSCGFMQRLAFAPISTMTDDTETPLKVLEDKYDNRHFRLRTCPFHTTEDRAEALSPSVSYIPFNQTVRKSPSQLIRREIQQHATPVKLVAWAKRAVSPGSSPLVTFRRERSLRFRDRNSKPTTLAIFT